MTFFGPTSPNETHYQTLFTGRQRFGNRSANMFFVRPARHIAAPRRLKYIHDIKTGYIPYVEDSVYPNQPPFNHVLQKMNNNPTNKNTGLGLYNSVDAWRHELMELAQQVKTTLIPTDEQEQYIRLSRSSRSNKHSPKRSNSSASSCIFEETNDEQNVSKRLLQQRAGSHYRQTKATKPKPTKEKSETEQTSNDENQDPGIWLIPILCYILQTDNIFEAQEWLVNANPTEKRLAMELISRTMHDMQNHDTELLSDSCVSELSSNTAASTPNINHVYWPYKIWQRQEKDRQQQQQQVQNFVRQSKLSAYPSLTSLTSDNGETCERATSPLRMLTPAKRLLTINHHPIAVETTIIERPSTRNSSDHGIPNLLIQRNRSLKTDQSTTLDKRPPSRATTPMTANGNGRLSRRSYRVRTSLNSSIDEESKPVSPSSRGKTPLI